MKPENIRQKHRIDQAYTKVPATMVRPPADDAAIPPPLRATAEDVRAFIESLGEAGTCLFR